MELRAQPGGGPWEDRSPLGPVEGREDSRTSRSLSQSETGFLTYLDVSVGKIVTALNARAGRLSVMAQNPYNAVIHLGHSNGQFPDFPGQPVSLVPS